MNKAFHNYASLQGLLILERMKNVFLLQCGRKKIAKYLSKLPKMISLQKWLILTHLQKLPKNVGDLGKLIVAKGFKKLSKVQ